MKSLKVQAILSKVNNILSDKAAKGEIKIAEDLKAIYVILYIIGGRKVADHVTNYYGSLTKGFATFSVKVIDKEWLDRILNPKNLTLDEKKVIREIEQILSKKDRELFYILKSKEKTEQNIWDVVNKINNIIVDLRNTFGNTFENILKKGSVYLSVRIKVDKKIILSIREHIKKNLKILELSRKLTPEGALSPKFFDDEEKIKIIDALFKVEMDTVQKRISKIIAERLKSKDIFIEKDEIIKLFRSVSSTYYARFRERFKAEVPIIWHTMSEPNAELAFGFRKYKVIPQVEVAPSVPAIISAEKLQLLMNTIRDRGINIPEEEIKRVSNLMNTASLIVKTAESFVNVGISEFLRGKKAVKAISDSIAKGINEFLGLKETNELSEAVKRIPEVTTKELVNVASKFNKKAKGSINSIIEKSGVDISKVVDKVQNDVFDAFVDYARDKKIKISQSVLKIVKKVSDLPIGKDLKDDLWEILQSGNVTEDDLISVMNYLFFDVVFVNAIILKDLFKAIADGGVAHGEDAEKIFKEILSNSILSDVPPSKRKVVLDNFVEAINEESIVPPIVLELPVGRNTKFGRIYIEAAERTVDEEEFKLFQRYLINEFGKILGRIALYSILCSNRFGKLRDSLSDFIKSLQRMAASILFGPIVGKDKKVIKTYKKEFERSHEDAVISLYKIRNFIAEASGVHSQRMKKVDRIVADAEKELTKIVSKLDNVSGVIDMTKSIELSKKIVDIAAVLLSGLFEDATGEPYEEFKAMAKNVENLSKILYGYVAYMNKTIKMGFVDDLPEIAALVASYSQEGSRKKSLRRF
jgi:hypothetical protein